MGRAFVDEAAKAAERAQQRDRDLVREMSEEATKAVEGTPSGAETVGSTAPPANTATRTPNLDKPDEPDRMSWWARRSPTVTAIRSGPCAT